MRWSMVACTLLLHHWVAGTAWGADDAPAAEAKPRMVLAVWDTVKPTPAKLTLTDLAGKSEWKALSAGQSADSFEGDAVLSNGRIVAALRKQEAAVELHAVTPDGVVARLRLRLLTAGGEPATHLESAALVENTRTSAC